MHNKNKLTGPSKGAWDAPLRTYIKTCPMVIIVYDLNDDIVEKEYKIDYGNADDRKWLGRLTFWAVTNNRSIECISLEDYEKLES